MTSLQAAYRPKMTGWRHGNRCTGLSCSWLFNNSKGQDTREKNLNPIPLFLMSFVWQEASQPRQRISAQECLMSKSTQKKRGGGRKPYARPSFPVAEFKRLREGRQGQAGARSSCAGAQQRRSRRRAERRKTPSIPCSSPSPALCSCCGCPRQPQDAARLRLLTVPCSPSLLPVTAHVIPPNTAHGAGAAVPTPVSPRGPASAPHGARCLHVPLPLRPGLFS